MSGIRAQQTPELWSGAFEIWIQKTPQTGDHIRVLRIDGLYAHHGVYISDNEVIHFAGREDDSILDWSKAEVISTDLNFFLKATPLNYRPSGFVGACLQIFRHFCPKLLGRSCPREIRQITSSFWERFAEGIMR